MGLKLKLMLTLIVSVIAPLVHGLGGSQSLLAQTPASSQSGDQTRPGGDQRGDVISSDFFTDTRPSDKNSKPAKSRYFDRRSVGVQRVPPKGKVFVKLGVTLGRGRSATDAEIKDNSLAKVNICAERRGEDCIRQQEMVVERISDDTPITDGTPIQMLIEYLAHRDAKGTTQVSGRVGYLYVINRVQFSDGTTSLPKLIFPSKRIFGGENRVLPG